MTTAKSNDGSDNQLAEKGALPDAPMAMPRQVLEAPRGMSMFRAFLPRATRAGN